MMARAHIIVTGLVQGVFFRFNTVQKAQELNVYGLVRNLRDGRVEIICEGAEGRVNKLVEWSKKGPEGAYVKNAHITWEQYTGDFETFEIAY